MKTLRIAMYVLFCLCVGVLNTALADSEVEKVDDLDLAEETAVTEQAPIDDNRAPPAADEESELLEATMFQLSFQDILETMSADIPLESSSAALNCNFNQGYRWKCTDGCFQCSSNADCIFGGRCKCLKHCP